MPINASIAVLAADSALASKVAQQISGHRRFSVQAQAMVNEADPSIAFGASISLSAISATPERFTPPSLGSFLAWGADVALLVVDSSIGIDGDTIQRVQEVAQHHPLLVAITGLNAPRADFDETLAVISRVVDQGTHVVAITLPVLQESEPGEEPLVNGILDLVDLEIKIHNPEGATATHALEQGHYDLIESHLDALTNAIIVTSTDEDLIHSVLEHGFESVDQLRKELLCATARRELIPIFAIEDSIGTTELAEFVCDLDVEPWMPRQAQSGTFLASAISNNQVRIWQGELTTGKYFADDTEIEIRHIQGLDGKAKAVAQSGEIIKIDTDLKIATGCTISAVKSSPLVIDHVFE